MKIKSEKHRTMLMEILNQIQFPFKTIEDACDLKKEIENATIEEPEKPVE